MAERALPDGRVALPPTPLPVPDDPCYGGPGPYAVSKLRDVTGARINPDALEWYCDRAYMLGSSAAPLHAASPQLPLQLRILGGFDARGRVVQRPAQEWPLEPVIPRISVSGPKLHFPLEARTYLLDYRDLASRAGPRPLAATVKERFPEGTQLLLGFFGDPELNWSLWGRHDFWEEPFLEQFAAIVTPDFSAYGNDPIPESLRGERMLQIFASAGSDAGHTIVPSVAWRSEDSLRRQLDLWLSQPKVHTIQLDCDGFGVNTTLWWWRWLYAIEKHVAGLEHIRWIVTGRPAGWVVRELNELLPKRNYALIPSVSLYLGCLSSSRGERWMAEQFARRIRRLEEFWSGEMVADRVERPERWPHYRDCLLEAPLVAALPAAGAES